MLTLLSIYLFINRQTDQYPASDVASRRIFVSFLALELLFAISTPSLASFDTGSPSSKSTRKL